MKIENLRKEIVAEKVRITAEVIWENRHRPSQEVYFETNAELEPDLYPNPNSFLLACALPAMRYGEERIAIDAPICPEIKDGLIAAMRCLINWHGGDNPSGTLRDRSVIKIEAPIQSQVFPDISQRAGAFFSGGIDALAMLRDNHLNFSSDHPRHIKDGILVYGILQGEDKSDPKFQNVIDAVSAIALDAGIDLIQVSTNAYAHFRDLDPDFSFWRKEYLGSFLAAIAHAFAPRLTIASIASTYDYACLEPWGSHPLLDPLYSSMGLQIRHENAALSRLEKTKLIGDWDVALKHLRVCNEKASYSKGNYNCGKCYKCLKTMTALLALGILDRADTFVEKDVSQELLVNNCYISDSYGEKCYLELIEPLSQLGRQDLIDGIRQMSKRYHERDLKGRIKKLDRTLFGGNILSVGQKIKTFK